MDFLFRGMEIIVGLYYLVFGLDGFFKKIPLPIPSDKALQFLQAIDETKYILLLVKLIEIAAGLAWVTGIGGGFAWLLMTPVWLNILAYQLFLNQREPWLVVWLVVSHFALAFKYWSFLQRVLILSFS